MIKTPDQMEEKVLTLKKKHRIVIAWAQDSNTIGAIHKAVIKGFAKAIMIGKSAGIIKICKAEGIDEKLFTIIDADNEIEASEEAVRMAKNGEADIVMKGLVGTDKFLKAIMCKMADRGQIKNCIIDGPLDIFLACDKKSIEIKGVETPVNGDADILLFPSLDSCNPFYKGLMIFAHGELAGLIRGTEKPVIVMSRSESEKSKYFCISLSCLIA